MIAAAIALAAAGPGLASAAHVIRFQGPLSWKVKGPNFESCVTSASATIPGTAGGKLRVELAALHPNCKGEPICTAEVEVSDNAHAVVTAGQAGGGNYRCFYQGVTVLNQVQKFPPGGASPPPPLATPSAAQRQALLARTQSAEGKARDAASKLRGCRRVPEVMKAEHQAKDVVETLAAISSKVRFNNPTVETFREFESQLPTLEKVANHVLDIASKHCR